MNTANKSSQKFISYLLFFLLLLGFSLSSQAGTITVDEVNCHLVDAITAANSSNPSFNGCTGATASPNTIDLQADVTLSTVVDSVDFGNTGSPPITSDITVTGNGHTIQRSTTIAGTPPFRILIVSASGILTLNNVTIANGISAGTPGVGLPLVSFPGGGILNNGILNVNNSTITHNSTSTTGLSTLPNDGGGIANANSGFANITASTISFNAAGSGGGFSNGIGTVIVTNSTISDNNAIFVAGTGAGGILNFAGSVILRNSTVSNNTSATGGVCGIFNNAGALVLNYTILDNPAPPLTTGNCLNNTGAITSLGFNLASDLSCNLTNTGDLQNTDPLLGPLQDNGGPTFTRAIPFNSPAKDAGQATCNVTTDQRGQPRPGAGSSLCDIGAYELQATVLTVTIDIKPGSFPNTINLKKDKVVPVAIISTASFDATQLDPASLKLAGAPVAQNPKGIFSCTAKDVNGDLRLDLVCQFVVSSLNLTTSSTSATLTGSTFGGQAITGQDSVRVIKQ